MYLGTFDFSQNGKQSVSKHGNHSFLDQQYESVSQLNALSTAQQKPIQIHKLSAGEEFTQSTELTPANVVILIKALSTALQTLPLMQSQRKGTGGTVSSQWSLTGGTRTMTS